MSLEPGLRLGPYEIVAPAGAGGMGEVYRARDTRLDRTVAIKVLTSGLSADPQLRERFDREARAISSLNHPHICTLHDIGHEGDIDFLVLEYLEGETLADRLARGGTDAAARALPVRDALAIAMQIADALDRAHRSGIVHRDLKPANVMLTKSGAKLLDFGLAKSAAPVVATNSMSMLPTTPPALTAQGAILGTFQYMAPEQIEGVEADARTDIFAFGALLFEMLTGRRAFEGKTRAQLLGAILKDEPPPVSTLQPRAPKALDRVVATCLEKDPDDRWQTARDLAREVKWASDPAVIEPPGSAPADAAASDARHGQAAGLKRRLLVAWTVAGIALAALLASAGVIASYMRERPTADPVQFTMSAPVNMQFGGPAAGGTGAQPQLAVSPDGRSVVFVARSQTGTQAFQLWIRPLAMPAPTPLSGTDDASFPFWSPDSRYVGFFAGGKLKKILASGGPPIVLCDASGGRGGTWSRNNTIVFSGAAASGSNPILQRVSAAGGSPLPTTTLDTEYGESAHRWPHFLPDGRHFLYTGITGACCPAPKIGRIRIASIDSKEVVTLVDADSSAAYASGYLLFNRINGVEGTLMAQQFDPDSRQLSGEAFPIAEQIGFEGSRYASFSVSDTGVLLYAHGSSLPISRLTWIDRDGKSLGTVGEPERYQGFALSRDDRKIAVAYPTGAPENLDIFVLDAVRGSPTRLTFDPGADTVPIWAPDGSRIAFQGNRTDGRTLRQRLVNGTAEDDTILADPGVVFTPTDWSLDGRFIAFSRAGGGTRFADVWVVPMTGDRKPFPVVETAGNDGNASFSPDGRWLAYESTDASQAQVFVQPFPPTGGKYQISKDGGFLPLWSADGRELFFLARGGTLMAVAVDPSRQFDATPRRLFSTGLTGAVGRPYAVAKDAKRFLVNVPETRATPTLLTVVVNWLGTIQK